MDSQPTIEQFLHTIPLFERVGASDLMELLRLLRPVQLETGEVLFREGETGRAMWVLGPGCEVELTAGPENRLLATLEHGATLGEMALIDDAPRSATATMKRGGGAYRIEAVDFDVLRDRHHPAAFGVLQKMAQDMCLRIRMVSVQIVPEGVGAPEASLAQRLDGERIATSTLDEFAPLRDAPATARLALAQKLTELVLQPGDALFREGEPSDALYFLVEGEMEARRHGTPFYVLGSGGLFGLVSSIDGGSRSATVAALKTSRVWRLANADFERLLHAGNRLAYRLIELAARQLAQNLRQANATLVARTAGPGEAGLTAASLGELDFNLSF